MPTIDGWSQDNVAASQSNVELIRFGASANPVTRYRAARAGSVLGVVATLSGTRGAGTLTITVFKNTGLAGAAGATIGLTAVLDGTNTQRVASWQTQGTDTYEMGDEIYPVVTTDGSWAPTTLELQVGIAVDD